MIWLFVLWLLAMIVGTIMIVLVFVAAIQNLNKSRERKRRKMRVDCIKKATGTIVESKQNGTHSPLVLKIQFQDGNEKYEFDEKALLVVEKVKWKGIPVGRKGHYPFDTKVGSHVNIKYNPKEPHIAYIVDNIGTCESI